jgi:hypothetical protein
MSRASEPAKLLPTYRNDVVLREKNIGLGVGGYRAVFTKQGNEVHILTIRRGAQRELGDHEIGSS